MILDLCESSETLRNQLLVSRITERRRSQSLLKQGKAIPKHNFVVSELFPEHSHALSHFRDELVRNLREFWDPCLLFSNGLSTFRASELFQFISADRTI